MKKHVSGPKMFLQLAAVLSVVGFLSITQAHAQAPAVNLQVNDSQSKLTVTSPGNCSQNNANGCIAAHGNQPINFNLTGQRTCTAGGDWNLSQVILGTSSGSQGNISAVAASDFNADQSTGVVTPNSRNPSGNQIQIQNLNTQVYDIWYTITATCGTSTINSDPRIVNDGTGR